MAAILTVKDTDNVLFEFFHKATHRLTYNLFQKKK